MERTSKIQGFWPPWKRLKLVVMGMLVAGAVVGGSAVGADEILDVPENQGIASEAVDLSDSQMEASRSTKIDDSSISIIPSIRESLPIITTIITTIFSALSIILYLDNKIDSNAKEMRSLVNDSITNSNHRIDDANRRIDNQVDRRSRVKVTNS